MESCSTFASAGDASMHLVLTSHVLEDTPNPDDARKAFGRVLGHGGAIVVVLSHPCFSRGGATESPSGRALHYLWSFGCFKPQQRTVLPGRTWCRGSCGFTDCARLTGKSFRVAGFDVVDLDEPRLDAGALPPRRRRGRAAPGPRALFPARVRAA